MQRYCRQNYRANFESKKTLKGALKKYKNAPEERERLNFD